jgi:hypothetical protein
MSELDRGPMIIFAYMNIRINANLYKPHVERTASLCACVCGGSLIVVVLLVVLYQTTGLLLFNLVKQAYREKRKERWNK